MTLSSASPQGLLTTLLDSCSIKRLDVGHQVCQDNGQGFVGFASLRTGAMGRAKSVCHLSRGWVRRKDRRRSAMRNRILSCTVLVVTLLAGGCLWAQVDTGAILGTIKDQSGAIIPGATVTLTNEGTGVSVSTKGGNDGSYEFRPIKIGTYSVAAEYKGFQKVEHPHVTVDVQQQVVIDLTLLPGQVTQTVEVVAASPLLQTQESSVGQVIGTREVNDLPLNGRNFVFLAQLSAGVTFDQQDTRGLGASGSFAANGSRPAQNNYMLDGIDNNVDLVDFLNGTHFVVL